jgi:hypothetical protein
MQNEIITPEVMPKAALTIIEQAGVETGTATQIRDAFVVMFSDADKWVSQAKNIRVTDVSQVREMKLARELRLTLREIRCNAENARKRLKADALAKGKAIDGIANVLKALVEPVEAYLQEQEDFAARVEAAKRDELRTARTQALAAYMDVTALAFDLAAMPAEQFDAMLSGARMKRDAEQAAELAKEQALIEAETKARKDAEEREAARQRELAEARQKAADAAKAQAEAERKAKADRAKAEAAAKAAKAKADAERAEMQAKIDAERKAREAAQAEVERKAAAEASAKAKAKAEAERIEAERKAAADKAAAAPDREKLLAFADMVARLTAPTMETEKGKAAAAMIQQQADKFVAWIKVQAKGV